MPRGSATLAAVTFSSVIAINARDDHLHILGERRPLRLATARPPGAFGSSLGGDTPKDRCVRLNACFMVGDVQTCPRCHGNLMLDREDDRQPEYLCLQCARRFPGPRPERPRPPLGPRRFEREKGYLLRIQSERYHLP